jgi:hypothetical protein
MDDLDFFNRNTGLGMGMQAIFSGQQRGEQRARHWSDMLSAEQNRSLNASREARQQELHPLEISHQKARNNQLDRQQKMEVFDTFVTTLMETDDPELAFAKSGAPREGKLAQLAAAPPEVRAKLYEQWTIAKNRSSEYTKTQDHLRTKEREAALQKEKRETQLEIEKERTARALQQAKLRSIQGKQAERTRNFAQAATHYLEAARLAVEAGDIEQAKVFENLANQMTTAHMASQTAPRAAAPGTPDMSAMGIPTVKPQQTAPTLQVPRNQPTPQPQQPQQPTVSNWNTK